MRKRPQLNMYTRVVAQIISYYIFLHEDGFLFCLKEYNFEIMNRTNFLHTGIKVLRTAFLTLSIFALSTKIHLQRLR